MYKTFLIIFSVAFGLGQQTYKSIHQAELEFNKENFLEPLYKPYNGPANPKSKIKKNLTKKVFGYHPYWQGTKWQYYNYDLLSTIAYFSAEAMNEAT